jgi:hypothetical protein
MAMAMAMGMAMGHRAESACRCGEPSAGVPIRADPLLSGASELMPFASEAVNFV